VMAKRFLPGGQGLTELMAGHLHGREVGRRARRRRAIRAELEAAYQRRLREDVVRDVPGLPGLHDVGLTEPREVPDVGTPGETGLVVLDQVVTRPGLAEDVPGRPERDEEHRDGDDTTGDAYGLRRRLPGPRVSSAWRRP